MTLAYAYPSGLNTFIPTFDAGAQGGLIIEYSRSPDKFALNKYTQLQQVEVEAGKYWRFDPNSMARVYTTDGSQFGWADGSARPAQNLWQGFEMPGYVTQRLNFGFQLGDLATFHAKKAGGVDLVSINSKMAAGAAMLQRTRKALAVATDTANGLPYFDLNAGTGGNGNGITYGSSGPFYNTTARYWDQGTAVSGGNAPFFRIGVNAIVAQIEQLTNANVQASDLNMVMGVDTAIALSKSLEILDYVKQSQFALSSINQDAQFATYGLPSKLFGVNCIVEKSSYVSTLPGSNTQTRSWVLPFGTIVFLSRPGGIEGALTSWSTLMGMFMEEMSVEVFDLPHDRLVSGNVVDNYAYVVTAPIAGFVMKKCVSGS